MFFRLNLSKKIFIVLLPLFLLAVGISVYLTHHYQEQQALEQMQSAARVQATIIKESLLQMMVTAERVDDAYLERIGRTREIENIRVWFHTDSLHLDPDLISPSRLSRLRSRELTLTPEQRLLAQSALSNGNSLMLVQCEIGQHTEGIVEVLSSGRPLWFRSCERLKVILPFTADKRCLECHQTSEGAVLGAAYMEMPLEKTAQALASNAERTVWIFGIFTLVAIGIGSFLFRAFVSRPVHRLIRATRVIGEGNLDDEISSNFSQDEFGELATSFDRMQNRLKETQEKMLHQERLSAVGKMASTIVHDLRSPLGAILLGFDFVQKNGARAGRPLLDSIRSSILRMNRMAQELLDFSRGEIQLHPRETSIPEFVQSLKEEIVPSLQQTRVEFSVSVGYDGTAVIDGDRLHRALTNIVNNAADAMPKGGEIRLETARDDQNLLFVISDNGPGIPAEIKDRIFDPFFTAGKTKGTGLGLSITQEIIKLHGGSISFESSPENGTTFFAKVPLRTESDQPAKDTSGGQVRDQEEKQP